jgi:hypothetical protein
MLVGLVPRLDAVFASSAALTFMTLISRARGARRPSARGERNNLRRTDGAHTGQAHLRQQTGLPSRQSTLFFPQLPAGDIGARAMNLQTL